MDIVKDLLKGANPIIILLLFFIWVVLGYLVFQVTNHIPTQIKEVRTELKTEIQEVRTELKTEIQEVRIEIKEVNKRLDKIIFYLIDKDPTKLTNKNQ